MNIEDHSYLPNVVVRDRSRRTVDNLGPVALRVCGKGPISETTYKLLQMAYKGTGSGDVKALAKKLGVNIEEKSSVTPYQISFGELRQLLPMGVVGVRDKRLASVGWVPAESDDAPELDGWKLRHKVHVYDNGGGSCNWEIKNAMRKPETPDSTNRMHFWMTPYIGEGFEFLPDKWYATFGYKVGVGKVGEDLPINYVDSARVKVELSVHNDKLFIGDVEFKLGRRDLMHGKRRFVFKSPSSYEGGEKKQRVFCDLVPTAIAPGESFDKKVFSRASGSDKPLHYEDLVALKVLEGSSMKNRAINERQSLVNLITAFEKSDFKALERFKWLNFAEH